MIEPKKNSLKMTPPVDSLKPGQNAYSESSVTNPYQEKKEELPVFEIFEDEFIGDGEDFITLSRKMSSDDATWLVDNEYSRFSDNFDKFYNKIGRKGKEGSGEVTHIEVTVTETEKWDDQQKQDLIDNIVKLLQAKKIKFSPKLQIKIRFKIIEGDSEMDQAGTTKFKIKYQKPKQ